MTGSKKLIIKVDKTTNFYKMDKKHYQKMFNVNKQKNWKDNTE